MSERRRAEIEAKRQKLAELRKARAERVAADNERKTSAEVRVHPASDFVTETSTSSPERSDRCKLP